MKALIRKAKQDGERKGDAGAVATKQAPEATLEVPTVLHSLPETGLPPILPAHAAVRSGSVQPVWLLEEWIPAALEQEILAALRGPHDKEFVQLRGKRTAKFGGDPGPPFAQEPLPPWLDQLCAAVAVALEAGGDAPLGGGRAAGRPNHVLVNQYRPGEGIMPHTDGPAYERWAAILSLNSAAVFDFWRDHSHAASGAPAALSLLVPPRSLLIFTGEAYSSHLHGIADRRIDDLEDGRVANWTAESSARWWLPGEGQPEWARRQLDKPPEQPRIGDAAPPCAMSREERLSLTIRHVPPTPSPLFEVPPKQEELAGREPVGVVGVTAETS